MWAVTVVELDIDEFDTFSHHFLQTLADTFISKSKRKIHANPEHKYTIVPTGVTCLGFWYGRAAAVSGPHPIQLLG